MAEDTHHNPQVTQIRREGVRDWQQLTGLDDVTADFVFISIDNMELTWAPPEETFPFYELVYVYAGDLRMWVAGEPLTGTKGDMFIIKPGVPHREESPPGKTSQLLCLATGFLNKAGEHCAFPLALPSRVHIEAGHVVERNLRFIASEAYHRGIGYTAAIGAYTMQIFIELLRSAHSVSVPEVDIGEIRRRRLASDAIRFLEDNHAAPLSLPDIAQHFFMSPYHFSRVFKDGAGISPMAYLTQVRIEQAKRLLHDPELTIKTIAEQVGYNDPHYFSKAFAKEEGITPTVYRQRILCP